MAVEKSDAAMVAVLISAGAKIDAPDIRSGRQPIHYATTVEVLEQLVKAGADVNARTTAGDTPLHTISGYDDIAASKWFFERKHDEPVDFDQSQTAPSNRLATARWLIEHGAVVDAKNRFGRTPLFTAVASDSPESVALLLKAGANPNATDSLNDTPLASVNFSKKVKESITLLLAAGAKIDALGAIHQTALISYVYHGNERAVATLLDAGADTSIQSRGSFSKNPKRIGEENFRSIPHGARTRRGSERNRNRRADPRRRQTPGDGEVARPSGP